MALNQVSDFQNRLKAALAAQDLSITDFAKKISYSKQAISAYINGSRSPKRPVIMAIANALNVNEAWLCGYDVPKERNQTPEQKNNQIIAIARGGEKIQYDLTEDDMQAILTILESMRKD